MRTYGRINGQWQVITTDANGFNDSIYMTTLLQVLNLNQNESPFYADMGIPAQQSVQAQTAPDSAVSLTQQYFAQYFPSVQVQKLPNAGQPYYNINVLTNSGAIINQQVPA
jgi:hypothetical protein